MPDLVSDAVDAYARVHTTPQSDLRAELAAVTHEKTDAPNMLIGPVEAQLLQTFVRLLQARCILELGCFTGYSALSMAEAMGDGGRLITCDVNEETTAIARAFWARSPHGSKIELRLGPAIETIRHLDGPFDMVFIDADKLPYIDYWEATVPLVRPGGLIVADNTLSHGSVLDPVTEVARAMDAFNRHVVADDRVDVVLLPVRDGVTVAQKRP